MTVEDRNYIPPVLIALTVAIVPHIFNLPIWISAWCILLWAWRWRMVKRNQPPPGKKTRIFLTGIGLLMVVAGSGRVFGGTSYTALLSVMAGLKPLETRNHRDRMVTVFLAYFLVIAGLFVSESLLITIYMFFSVIVSTGVLITINHPRGSMRDHLKIAGRIMAQSLPFMILLFFFFPRIQGSLWGSITQGRAKSGFSDRLMAGAVSNLVKDDSVAFRAVFQGKLPPPQLLYWRGIVFLHYNYRSWVKSIKPPLRAKPIDGEKKFSYTILLEPHRKKYLFALDLPVSSSSKTRILADHTMIYPRKVRTKIRYRVNSVTKYSLANEPSAYPVSIRLPTTENPRAHSLAKKWAREMGSPEQFIQKVLDYFSQNNFVYTLNPPRLGSNPVDEFLFKTRKGYCEHYASAFAFLLRAAGIPARLVGGYLGGRRNPYGNYIIVRQSDAHVWTEVWLKKKGWVRVDPTASVSPERIQQGIEEALNPDELPDFLSRAGKGSLYEAWNKIRYGWDAINNMWDIWFSGYSLDQQREILKKIGLGRGSWKNMIKTFLPVLLVIILFSVLFLIRYGRKKTGKTDPEQKIYARFVQNIERIGIRKPPEQGPVDFSEVIIDKYPELKDAIREITDCYITIRYGGKRNKTELQRLKILVNRFHPDISVKNRLKA